MVITPSISRGTNGWMMAEIAVAVSLIFLVMIPLGYTFHREHKLALALYQRAVITQLVDGEAEFLRAGEWKNLKPGEQQLHPVANAAVQLKNGELIAVRGPNFVRLEWRLANQPKVRWITREFLVDETGSSK